MGIVTKKRKQISFRVSVDNTESRSTCYLFFYGNCIYEAICLGLLTFCECKNELYVNVIGFRTSTERMICVVNVCTYGTVKIKILDIILIFLATRVFFREILSNDFSVFSSTTVCHIPSLVFQKTYLRSPFFSSN